MYMEKCTQNCKYELQNHKKKSEFWKNLGEIPHQAQKSILFGRMGIDVNCAENQGIRALSGRFLDNLGEMEYVNYR